ncbi:hypothetical protein GGH20_003930, partial [Coemansia sp. RSA 1937]
MPRNKPGLSLRQLGFDMENNGSPVPGIPAGHLGSRAPAAMQQHSMARAAGPMAG